MHAHSIVAVTSAISYNGWISQRPVAAKTPAVEVWLAFCSMAATKLEAQLYVQMSNGSLNPFERKVELAGSIGDYTF